MNVLERIEVAVRHFRNHKRTVELADAHRLSCEDPQKQGICTARFGDLLLFYFHCHHYSSTFFALSFHGGKWGDSGWL